jgi:hypothetical protein
LARSDPASSADPDDPDPIFLHYAGAAGVAERKRVTTLRHVFASELSAKA